LIQQVHNCHLLLVGCHRVVVSLVVEENHRTIVAASWLQPTLFSLGIGH
jgi:hypothetical protein